jgi:D-amino-acid dehydrogenase
MPPAGLRPVTWDGPPILGPMPIAGFCRNSGHGFSGSTQACGVYQIVADIVSGQGPAIDLDGLTLRRFTH